MSAGGTQYRNESFETDSHSESQKLSKHSTTGAIEKGDDIMGYSPVSQLDTNIYNQVSSNEGENLLTLNKGTNYMFELQIPIIGKITNTGAINTSGSTYGWEYQFSYVDQLPAETISAPGSVSNYYNLIVSATFYGLNASESIVLDGSLTGQRLSLPGLVYLTSILTGITNYNSNMFNILFLQVVPWYDQIANTIANIPNTMVNFFANLRQSMDNSGQQVDLWLTNNIGKPVSSVGSVFYNIFAWIIKALYYIWYFLIEAWPLWMLIGVIFIIWEVKKWKTQENQAKTQAKLQAALSRIK